MAQALLVRRGSGGGSGKISVKAYSSIAALPTAGKDNEIAVIAESIGFVTADSFAPVSPASGDVWVKVGGSDMHKIAVIDSSSQYVAMPVQGVYVYFSGLWVLADAYLWNGTQWDSIPTVFFCGTDRCLAVTGGWALQIGYAAIGNNQVIDYDDRIKIDGVSCNASAGTAGTYHTVNTIDLTNFTTLYVRMRFLSKTDSADGPFFYVADNYVDPMYSIYPHYYVGNGSVPAAMQTYSIDVSAETGSKYISIGCYGAGSRGTMSWEMDKVWGV